MANTNTCIPREIATKLKQQFKAKKPLTPNELRQKISDLVKEKYNVNLNPADAEQIVKLNGVLRTAKEKLGDNIGSLDHEKQMIDYFKAENSMNEYLKGLDPSSQLAVATGTIGRGVMLTSIKSPLINIGSNLENTLVESLTRRVAGGQFLKANSDLTSRYFKMANKIYDETGVDISRMMDLGDLGIGGQRVLGKDTVSAVGEGGVRKVGRFFEDKIFKQLMGKPDSLTANYNFADSALLNATKAAKGEMGQANKIARDAMLLNPRTNAGKAVRAQAVLDAQVATYTQRTALSGMSEGIRNLLNKVTGDLRFGDWLMPFVKTPANIISTSADYAGLGIFKGLYETIKGLRDGTLKNPETIRSIATNLTRSGLGMTAALAISSFFEPEDFVGAYDPKRNQIEQLKNSNYNAVKIGDRWVSTEWFGPLAIPLTAMMYAKKGEGYINKMHEYSKGIMSSITEIPGVDILVSGAKNLQFGQDATAAEIGTSAAKSVTDQIASRLIPGIVIDIGKAIDPNQRDTSGDFLGSVKSKIPFVRQTLPVKQNVFGENLKRESVLETILFGARVKKENASPIVKEVDSVTSALGKGSSFTDWNKTTSKHISQFKEKVGEAKFNQAKTEYGQILQTELGKLFSNSTYQKMSDEDKLYQINLQDDQAKETIFKKYRFKPKEDKSKPKPKL